MGAAQAAFRTASAFSNPELEIDRETPSGGARESTWRLAWTPPLNGRRGLSLQSAGAEVSAAEKDLDSTRLRLRTQMRAAYANWVVSSERTVLLSSHLELVEDLAERMAARAARGEESRLAAGRLEMAAVQVQADLSLERAALGRARATALAWRKDLNPSLQPLRPTLAALAVAPAERDLAARSDLEAHRLELDGAKLEERLSRRFVTFPQLHFGWQSIEHSGLHLDGPVYGARWSIPLFSRGQGARLGALRKRESLEARLSVELDRAEGQLEGARLAFDELSAAAAGMTSGTEKLGTLVASAEAAYRLGESTVTDLLDSLRSVLAARLSALELYDAALEAHRRLETAVGRPLSTGGI